MIQKRNITSKILINIGIAFFYVLAIAILLTFSTCDNGYSEGDSNIKLIKQYYTYISQEKTLRNAYEMSVAKVDFNTYAAWYKDLDNIQLSEMKRLGPGSYNFMVILNYINSEIFVYDVTMNIEEEEIKSSISISLGNPHKIYPFHFNDIKQIGATNNYIYIVVENGIVKINKNTKHVDRHYIGNVLASYFTKNEALFVVNEIKKIKALIICDNKMKIAPIIKHLPDKKIKNAIFAINKYQNKIAITYKLRDRNPGIVVPPYPEEVLFLFDNELNLLKSWEDKFKVVNRFKNKQHKYFIIHNSSLLIERKSDNTCLIYDPITNTRDFPDLNIIFPKQYNETYFMVQSVQYNRYTKQVLIGNSLYKKKDNTWIKKEFNIGKNSLLLNEGVAQIKDEQLIICSFEEPELNIKLPPRKLYSTLNNELSELLFLRNSSIYTIDYNTESESQYPIQSLFTCYLKDNLEQKVFKYQDHPDNIKLKLIEDYSFLPANQGFKKAYQNKGFASNYSTRQLLFIQLNKEYFLIITAKHSEPNLIYYFNKSGSECRFLSYNVNILCALPINKDEAVLLGALGSKYRYYTDFVLIYINNNGKEIRRSNPFSTKEKITKASLNISNDKDIIFLGHNWNNNPEVLIKIDRKGTVLWEKYFKKAYSPGGIISDKKGNIFFYDENGGIFCFTNKGELKWNVTINTEDDFYLNMKLKGIILLNNLLYTLGTTEYRRTCMICLDKKGKVLWKKFIFPLEYHSACDIKVVDDKHLLLCTTYKVLLTDLKGNIIKEARVFTRDAKILPLSKNEFLFAGVEDSFTVMRYTFNK